MSVEDNDQLFECILQAVHTRERRVKTVPCFCNHQTLYLRITTDLLRGMAESGKLDADILGSFYESGVWEKPAINRERIE